MSGAEHFSAWTHSNGWTRTSLNQWTHSPKLFPMLFAFLIVILSGLASHADAACTDAADCDAKETCSNGVCSCNGGSHGDTCHTSLSSILSGLPSTIITIIIVSCVVGFLLFVVLPIVLCCCCCHRASQPRGGNTHMVMTAVPAQNNHVAMSAQGYPHVHGQPLHAYPAAQNNHEPVSAQGYPQEQSPRTCAPAQSQAVMGYPQGQPPQAYSPATSNPAYPPQGNAAYPPAAQGGGELPPPYRADGKY